VEEVLELDSAEVDNCIMHLCMGCFVELVHKMWGEAVDEEALDLEKKVHLFWCLNSSFRGKNPF